jgi:hypothetical protein
MGTLEVGKRERSLNMRMFALVIVFMAGLIAPAFSQKAEIAAVNAKWVEFFNKGPNVYGGAIPGADGRAGMAALVVHDGFNNEKFREHLITNLPPYARPVFVRICSKIETTTTFKYTKGALVRDGYNPKATTDRIFFNDSKKQAFIEVDNVLYERIQTGMQKL